MTSSVASSVPSVQRGPLAGHAVGAVGFLIGVWGSLWVAQQLFAARAASAGRSWEPNDGLFLLAVIVMLPCHALTVALFAPKHGTGSLGRRAFRSFAVGVLTFGVCLLLGPKLAENVVRDDGPLLYLMMLALPTVGVTWFLSSRGIDPA